MILIAKLMEAINSPKLCHATKQPSFNCGCVLHGIDWVVQQPPPRCSQHPKDTRTKSTMRLFLFLFFCLLFVDWWGRNSVTKRACVYVYARGARQRQSHHNNYTTARIQAGKNWQYSKTDTKLHWTGAFFCSFGRAAVVGCQNTKITYDSFSYRTKPTDDLRANDSSNLSHKTAPPVWNKSVP